METDLKTAGVLSAEQRARFDNDGYVVFDPEIPKEILEGVLSDLEEMYRYSGEDHIDESGAIIRAGSKPRVLEAWKTSENVRRVALAPKVLAACEELYGSTPLPFQTLNFPVGTEQAPHADSMHFNSEPPGVMCGVWLALEDMDMDNGTLLYFPGSHKLPLPTWDEIGRPVENDYPHYKDLATWIWKRYGAYDTYVQEIIERHGFEPEYAIIPKGHALIWAANLIHGGAPQRDPERTRHSQVTHYYFEGCRYYTPMRSEDSRIFWRYPWWVRSEGAKDEPSAVLKAVADHLPADATVAVMSQGKATLGSRVVHPLVVMDDADDPSEGGEPAAVRDLERLRAEGAEYLLVARHELNRLVSTCNNLQSHLEAHYPAILRDGGACAIYDLRDRRAVESIGHS